MLSACSISSRAEASTAANSETRCAALRDLKLEGVQLKSAKVPSPDEGQPEYCRVTGLVDRARFELRLPTAKWNGKFYMAGCGTLCGVVGTGDPAYVTGITRGYATITTDAGHNSWTPLGSKWARDDVEARTDHAWRAVHRTAQAGRAITQAYYGGAARKAYFNGCSNGGRQGLMEAARFPEDFDGIIAESPAQEVLGNVMLYTNTLLADRDAQGREVFDRRKVPLLHDAVLRACGDETGVVPDPLSCTFDPAELQCAQGNAGNCLSAEEVRVARAWYAGPPPSKDYNAQGGAPRGSEVFWTPRGGIPWMLRTVWAFMPGPPLDSVLFAHKAAPTLLMRDLLSEPAFDMDYDAANFDAARDLPRLKHWAAEMTPSRDLAPLRARGGKLLITQSTADATVPPAYTVDYWREAQSRLGAGAADTLRMFMVPGMGHCLNGDGPVLPGYDLGDYDPLTALERWVEQGEAPAALIAAKHDAAGTLLRSQPLCALPARAVYRGQGERNDPASWECR